MKSIIIIFLVLLLVISLYSFLFNDGQAIKFEQFYKDSLSFLQNIGNWFDGLFDGSGDNNDGETNPGQSIFDFFADLIMGGANRTAEFTIKILNFFGICTHGGYECPDPCPCQCKECV